MLQSLHVKNLALIDETEVEFKPGLNILSGETGAGKSIIIGSISLALGEKVPRELLRDNDDSALVELVFVVEDEFTRQALAELAVDTEDDLVILSRKITSGRAVARINGEAVSVAKLKTVAALLIDIHGQHEHQSLMSGKKQLEVLDAFARHELGDRKERISACYREYRKLSEEWEQASMDESERKKELSFLEYEVKEIRDAQLKPGEDGELEEAFRRFSNSRKIMDAVGNAAALTGGDTENSQELVGRALREISGVVQYDSRLTELEQQLMDIDSLLSDFHHEISAYLDTEDFDEETCYETEKRLDLINHLKSKYGNSVEEILSYCEEKEKRIAVLSDYDEYLNQLLILKNQKQKELDELCGQVSDIRKAQAQVLTCAIKEALSDLNFLDVKFTMDFQKTEDYTASGIDDARFMISTNPGEPLKPLAAVASGGELSRIALAVKTVMAESDQISTLIFDEIDSGISGRTAQMVSEKMHLLAANHQIICITHLPQIAAMADAHFLIEKSVEHEATVSRIHLLDEEESIRELARMLGGAQITDTVLMNAREMKAMAHMK